MRRLPVLVLLAALVLAGCKKNPDDGSSGGSSGSTGSGTARCNIDLSRWTNVAGSGASARIIESADELIGGEAADARLGDTLMANDKIRVVIQQPGRIIGPNPFGGALIDADLVHPGPGNDKFGKMATFFNFGRTVNVDTVEVLAPGDQGGPAIVAATGTDTVNDFINVNSKLGEYVEGAKLAIDTEAAVDLRITTYYALLPGQSHVSVVTAFCNDAQTTPVLTAGDLIDSGGDVALFDPQSSTNGLGFGANPDPMTWLGWMANDNSIAYGIAPWKLNDLETPSTKNNSLTVAGVTGYIIENQGGLTGLSEWLNASARGRSGTLIVPAQDKETGKPGQVVIGREFAVGRDMAMVAQEIERVRAAKTSAPLATYGGTVRDATGPVANARVVAERPDILDSGKTMREALFVTDADGNFSAQLPKDSYTFTAYKPGHAVSASVTLAGDAADTTHVALQVGEGHTLTVTAADARSGQPIPAKLTVLCGGSCVSTPASLVRFEDFQEDTRPDDVQFIGFIPPTGTLSVDLPAGRYQVMVTHGPEDSIWPLSAPGQGQPVDLTSANQSLAARLAKVVDTTGWLSDDFHVHSVNSPDSPVGLDDRVKSFLAEDVNILTATDHDFVTDYRPVIAELGGTPFLDTVIGEELTTFDYGHYNPWPMPLDESSPVNHGAIDWGNGTGPGMLIDQIIDAARAKGATTFQINHPNGKDSTFGAIELDADTLKTHADPARFRLPPSPNASGDDTGLFPRKKWDAMEVMNGFTRSSFDGLLNNWMTFTANGLVVTATAVSDTHKRWSSAGGYPRSYVQMPADHDTIATFDQAVLSQQVNAHHVTGSLGLFAKAYAFKTGTAYALTSLEADCTAAGPACARVGDTLPIDASGLDVVVDVQSPEWIPFDEVSLFSHQAARWMKDGEPNSDFAPTVATPAGYWASSATPVLEPVFTGDANLGCGQASCPVNRWHAQAVFHIDQASGNVPTGDDFFFAVARNADQSQDLMPLVYDGVLEDNGTMGEKPAHAFAFTNAIFVDRDGSGYDHPPHVQDAAGAAAHHHARPQARAQGPLADRLEAALHQIAIER